MMSGIRKLFFWAIILVLGYYGLDYVKVHTSGDVLAYKRFAKALLKNDHYTTRQTSSKELAVQVLSRKAERQELYNGARVLFTYFEVVSQSVSGGGESSSLIVEQVSRVGSKGQVGVWGDGEIRIRHTVELEKENHLWKVTRFFDPAMR